ncbi:hypothetical protein RA2_04011 [Roseovarius sp. A-2]|uniref:hypothetical protein n=1 Tax=Roseovarius sp. A-2 TaxID=1570360 RepID=UPI0009B58788|nr:hypothetical protein [Roseovarius sp. A-2]GAW36936.1 hypothetical protein RA2_04011 [Roseovarius sp. A-2]
MSLDFGFNRQDESVALWFHNHWDFLDMFTEEPLVQLETPNDFYVTRPMVSAVIKKIEAEMVENDQPVPAMPACHTQEFAMLEEAIPWDFHCAEPEDWEAALPHYRVLLYRLLADVRTDGCLICGWDA